MSHAFPCDYEAVSLKTVASQATLLSWGRSVLNLQYIWGRGLKSPVQAAGNYCDGVVCHRWSLWKGFAMMLLTGPAQPTSPKNRKQATEFRVDNLRIGWSYALRIGRSYRQKIRIGRSYFDPLLKHLPWTKKALENGMSIFPKMQLAVLENHTCAFRKQNSCRLSSYPACGDPNERLRISGW